MSDSETKRLLEEINHSIIGHNDRVRRAIDHLWALIFFIAVGIVHFAIGRAVVGAVF